jgi:hypothetical protein
MVGNTMGDQTHPEDLNETAPWGAFYDNKYRSSLGKPLDRSSGGYGGPPRARLRLRGLQDPVEKPQALRSRIHMQREGLLKIAQDYQDKWLESSTRRADPMCPKRSMDATEAQLTLIEALAPIIASQVFGEEFRTTKSLMMIVSEAAGGARPKRGSHTEAI